MRLFTGTKGVTCLLKFFLRVLQGNYMGVQSCFEGVTSVLAVLAVLPPPCPGWYLMSEQ